MLRKLVTVLLTLVFVLGFSLIPPQNITAQPPDSSFVKNALNADSIVLGKVVSLSSQWNTAHTRISTNVAIMVEETIKGAYRNTVNLIVSGGTAEGITEWVSDAPVFREDERAIVFLKEVAKNRFEVYGQVQGKFTVENDKVNGIPILDFKQQISGAMKGTPVTPPAEIWIPSEMIFSPPDGLLNNQIPDDKSPDFKSGWTTITSEGFEGTFPPTGWVATGPPGIPTWGRSSYTAAAGTYSAWCAGSAGSPGVYANSMNAWLVYGPVNLSDATAGTLSLSQWVRTITGDSFRISASTNGSNFYSYVYNGPQGAWGQSSLDLTAWGTTLGNLCGRPQVWFAFLFISDTSSVDTGAFVDAVQIQKYTGVIPHITSTAPTQASAGTNSQITVTGTGFGTTPGSVEFFYRSGQPYIPGDIISWSDTSIVTTVPVGDVDGYPASASSGPLYVVNADGTESTPSPFTVTFSYGGMKWAGASPTVNYYVNPNTDDCGAEETAVRNAAATWTAVIGKSFVFNYAGTTPVTAAGRNNFNEIMWVNLGNVGTLAHAVGWSDVSGNIIEVDIEFNDYYTWSTAATPPSGQYDVESLGLHELGHWLCLRDLYGNVSGYPQDADKVMFGFGPSGQTKRTLHANDIAGVRWIYPYTGLAVSTLVATDVAKNSAQLNGNLGSKGSAQNVVVSFEWGETDSYGQMTTPETKTEIGDFSFNLTDLGSNKTYCYRAKAVGLTTVYGEGKSFVTGIDAQIINGKIAFSAQPGSPAMQVYIMNSNGSTHIKLTNTDSTTWNSAPCLSRIGAKIVFYSQRSGSAIYTMNSDGSTQTKIAQNDYANYHPCWSPDSARIVFHSDRNYNEDIYIMNADGSNEIRLTDAIGIDKYPVWSPDGTRIAFMSNRDGSWEIYVMDSDGGNQTRLTNNIYNDSNPAWSPNSSKIVFDSHRNSNNDIYCMNSDGSNEIRLTNNTAADEDPTWSPDGSKILFSSSRDSTYELYTMNPDGSNQSRLTNNSYPELEPSWGGALSPTITTGSTNGITQNSAQLNGNLSDKGFASSIQVSFEWGETNAYGHSTLQETRTELGDFVFNLTGLLPNHEYHYRAKAVGDGTSYGDDVTFTTKRQYSLTIDKTGNGNTSPAPGAHNYMENEVVQLTATPDPVWVFSHWSGDASGTATQISVTMNSNKSITANFALEGVTLISRIKENPTAYEGQMVKISGGYRGWETGHGSPPVTRSDWVLQDETGSIYVTGIAGLKYPDDLGKPVQATGIVRIKDGQPYIEVPRAGRR